MNSDGRAELGIVFVMAVWGPEYVGKFLNIALPTLMADGNVPAVAKLARTRFLLITRESDVAMVREDALFAKLSTLVELSVATFVPEGSRYSALSHAHMVAVASASEHGEAAVFLTPDAIFSNGSLAHVVKMALGGCRAVMCTGLRLIEETVRPILDALPRTADGALALAPRETTKLALAHLHPEIERYIWGNPEFTAFPHLCMWPAPDGDGFLARAFHLHPLLVDFRGLRDVPDLDRTTIDGNFLGHLVGRWDDIGIVEDTDDVSIYSLTPLDQRQEYVRHGAATVETLRGMAYHPQVNPLHRYFFTKAIRIHSHDASGAWSQLEEETGRQAYLALDLNVTDRPGDVIQHLSGRELLRLLGAKVYQRARLGALRVR